MRIACHRVQSCCDTTETVVRYCKHTAFKNLRNTSTTRVHVADCKLLYSYTVQAVNTLSLSV
jgi:hypothetical protein